MSKLTHSGRKHLIDWLAANHKRFAEQDLSVWIEEVEDSDGWGVIPARDAESGHEEMKQFDVLDTYYPVGPFITPPECQGQTVECSYAYDHESRAIIERRADHSDRSVKYFAYDADESDAPFEPWNSAPALGPDLGECTVG